ncbi:MAG: DUF2061 domain-containing protein [Candidatus Coatesbacteria bacterium]
MRRFLARLGLGGGQGRREWAGGTDLRVRSLLKAASWRLFGTAVTVAIALSLTGRLGLSAVIGAADLVAKIVLYYLHERFWDNVDLFRRRPPDYEI